MTTKLLTVALLTACFLSAIQAEASQPPNIIFIMSDDHAYQAISAYQDHLIQTPNIDRLAEEGMLFARMYTEPGCTPSRSAITTGQHPVRNGVYEIGFPIEYSGMAAKNVKIEV